MTPSNRRINTDDPLGYDNFWNAIVGKVVESGDNVEANNQAKEAQRLSGSMFAQNLLYSSREKEEAARKSKNALMVGVVALVVVSIGVVFFIVYNKNKK